MNGFGRIGRAAFKIIAERDDLEVVAINDLTDAALLAHLLEFDTAYGRLNREVSAAEGEIVVDGKSFPVLAEPEPRKLPWKDFDVDVVLECTGRFVKDGAARAHLEAGARTVVVSAPVKGKGDIPTAVVGVNREKKPVGIVSNASCTTNCIAPVTDIVHRAFGVRKSLMSTVHSYTANQNLQDGPHKDPRRARAAAANLVPTTTGAAIATTEVIPDLKGLFDGIAIRVPTITVSLADITFLLEKETTLPEVEEVFRRAAASEEWQGVFAVTDKPLVSSDFIGNPASATVDLSLLKLVGGDLLKVVA
ncbi:MAG TPA: type I glyceraldehyde-3-phosphate dehydrogenase [Candidatus Moranbacteria bacterium]|nr:type I glyceraldehyde-3-phosphate dehydrogenase [Candidatus Moranbacteria bacterium]